MKQFLLLVIILIPTAKINAQWQTYGPYSGSINCLVQNGSNLYAGTENGGLFVSTDTGASWVDLGFEDAEVNTIAFSGSNIFVGTNFGVYLSADNGGTWKQKNSGLTSTNITKIVIDGDYIYACTNFYGGIFLSTNNATTWAQAAAPIKNYWFNDLELRGSELLVSTFHGIFTSSDSGATWNQRNNGLTDTAITSIGIHGAALFAGAVNSGKIFMSTNNADNWSQLATPLTPNDILGFSFNGNDIFLGSSYGAYLSHDTGRSWISIDTGFLDGSSSSVGSFIFVGSKVITGAAFGGILVSTNNGRSWSATNYGMFATNTVCFAANNAGIFAGTSEGIFLSVDSGRTWIPKDNGLYYSTDDYSFAVNGNNIFVGTAGTGVFVSSDNGDNWNWMSNGITNTLITGLATMDSMVFAATQGGVFMTSDNGTNWAPVNNGLTNLTVNNITTDGTVLMAGTYGGIFLSTDTGKTWVERDTGITDKNIYAIAINGSQFFVSGFGAEEAYISNDGCKHWSRITGGLNVTVSSFAFTDTGMYIGTAGSGVYISRDTGNTWTQIDSGLKNTSVNSVWIHGSTLFAGTAGGVWLYSSSGTATNILENQKRAIDFSLYPNPAGNNFVVETNGKAGQLLNIFDLNGKMAITRVLRNTKTSIDIGNLPCGVYTVCVTDGDMTSAKKLVVTR